MSAGAEIQLLPLVRVRDRSAGEDLAWAVRRQFTKYVAFHSEYAEAEADFLTLWVMHTHVFGAADATPYVLITSPTPEAGKTQILDVAEMLVARPHAVVDPSPASLFRLIDGVSPTLLIDEVDELATSPAIKQVLNAGSKPGRMIPRTETIDGVKVIIQYRTFCAKAFCGIAGQRPPLKGATLSRCVEVPMRRRTGDESVVRFKRRTAQVECDPIRRGLEEWAIGAEPVLMMAAPTLPDLGDRQTDHWEPLCAIAELIGGDWPRRAHEAAEALSAARNAKPDPGTQIIADMRKVWDKISGPRAHTATLAAMRNELEDREYDAPLSAHELSMWLGRFDIHPIKPFRLHGSSPLRGYEEVAFADAFRRYVYRGRR